MTLREKIMAVVEKLEAENQTKAVSLAFIKPISFYENNSIEDAARILKEENGGRK